MANITGTDGDNILTGTVNDDVINGLAGNDTIDAGDGNDIIIGGLGADKMSGGIGNDEFLVGGTEIVAGETIDGGTGNNKISTWGGDLSLATITNVQTLGLHLNSLKLSATQMAGFTSLTAYNNAPVTLTAANAGTYSLANKTVTGTFNLTGSSGNDKLVGNAAAQTLDGGDGNDTIVGGLGADTMLGGAGDDEFLAGGTEIVAGEIIDGGTGYNTLSTWGGDLSLATITNVQKLGVHLNNIKLTAAQLTGFWDIQAYDGPVTITAAGAGLYALPYRSAIGIFNFVGSSGVDDIFGNLLTQTIDGGDGNDYLATAKVIHGGGGDDTVDGIGIDGAALYGDDGNDSIYGGINDKMYGGNGNDFLAGSIGINAMDGGNDNDVLRGDLSADTLTGGGGADRFVYSTTADSTATQSDVITDFVEGTDKIDVTGLGFGGLSTGIVKAGQLKVSYDAALNRTTIADLFGSNFSLILNGNHLNIGSNDFIGLQNVINGTNGNDYLVGTAQNDILSGLDGNDVLQGGLGADTMLGGNGDDEFLAGGTEIAAGEIIDGGTGNNTLSTWGGDLSLATILNVQTLGMHLDHLKLSAEQMASFNNLVAYGSVPVTLTAANAGRYDFVTKAVVTGTYNLVGSSGDDIFFGSAATLTLSGGDGNDIIASNPAAVQTMNGGKGNDLLYANATLATINGDEGNDTIVDGLGVAKMFGGDGDDVFELGTNGAAPVLGDSIDGGSGLNTLTAKGNISPVIIKNVQSLTVDGGYIALTADQFNQFSTVQTINGFPTGAGTTYTNIEVIGSGVVDLRGKTANDLIGLYASATGNTLIGNDLVQSLYGGAGDDILYGYGGDDWLEGREGNNTIFGGDGNDTFNQTGAAGINKFYGEGGDDRFDFVYGGLLPGSIVDGGIGNNTLSNLRDISGATILNIQTLQISYSLTLNASQLLQLSHGVLWESVRPYLPMTVVAATAGTYDVRGITHTAWFGGISGSNGDDQLIGDDDAQTIYGNRGADTLYGMGGDDTIYGFMDTQDVSAFDGDVMFGGDGSDQIFGSSGNDTIWGGNGDDKLYGGSTPYLYYSATVDAAYGGNDTIYGEAGNDTISIYGNGSMKYASGGDGDDTIAIYGDGTKLMYGDAGNDHFYVGDSAAGSVVDGGSGINTVTASGDIAQLAMTNIQNIEFQELSTTTLSAAQFSSFVTLDGKGTAKITSSGTYDLTGRTVSGSAVSITGANGVDVITGDSASQTLDGAAGNDTIYGKDGNDVIYGGAGVDTLYGNNGADVLIGGSENDTLYGNDGDDNLAGESGDDILDGGAGNNYYGFTRGDGRDTIIDTDAVPGGADWITMGRSSIDHSQGIAHDQLWFTRQGNDLIIQLIGTNDSLGVRDWYVGSTHRIENIMAVEQKTDIAVVAYYLTDSAVQNLVNAMAGFAVPSTTTLSAAYHAALDPVLAANWTSV